jgi:hypothetical protein
MTDRKRYTCTQEAPWTPERGAAEHPGAEYLGDDSDGCCERYQCSNCGLRFRVTLPSH